MHPFFDFVKSVPDVIWSGLIASVLTLSGVLISNRSNTNRLAKQLTHDSLEKQKERKSTLRQEAYLSVAEELTKANNYLSSMPWLDLSSVNAADGLKDFFAAAAKLQLVAETKTALLINQLSFSYGELCVNIIRKLSPVSDLRIEHKICHDSYVKHQSEIDRILVEMRRLNETAQTNEAVWNSLNSSFEFHRKEANEFSERRGLLADEIHVLCAEVAVLILRDMVALSEQQINVQIEIRRDLELTSDLDDFRLQMQDQVSRSLKSVENMIDSLKFKDFPSNSGR